MATFSFDYSEPTQAEETEATTPRGTKLIGIDFTTGLAIMENNGIKLIDGAETLLQRIIKFLRTEKNHYEIYKEKYKIDNSADYGFSIFEAIGYTFTSVVLSSYTREIRNFLLNEYDVVSVDSLRIIPVEDKILIDITLASTYGNIEIKEVIGGNSLYHKGI